MGTRPQLNFIWTSEKDRRKAFLLVISFPSQERHCIVPPMISVPIGEEKYMIDETRFQLPQ